MIISQLVPFVVSRGISSTSIASAALLVGAFGNVLGRFFSGWMSDALGRLNVLRLMIAVSAVAMPLLAVAGECLDVVRRRNCCVLLLWNAALGECRTVPGFLGHQARRPDQRNDVLCMGNCGNYGPRIGGLLFDKYHNYRIAFDVASLAVTALLFEFLAKRPTSSTELSSVEPALPVVN